MMGRVVQRIEIFQIDAFTDKMFHGNPAAVCILSEWLNDEFLQAIAIENNLSETAFVVQNQQGLHIRWFTPNAELSLCGHATLAAAFVLFEQALDSSASLQFSSLSGPLTAHQKAGRITLDFPRLNYTRLRDDKLTTLVDRPVLECYESEFDYLFVLASSDDVLKAEVCLTELSLLPKRGLILTSACDELDFYSRCFYPKHNIPEDPVTGSAHCVLIPYWANRLNKTVLSARQGARRRGEIFCELADERVLLSGSCRLYMQGNLLI